VNCMPRRYEEDDTGGRLRPERELQRALAERIRTRQAAALYLHAATMTDDAAVRSVLRRRAARLILPEVPRLAAWSPRR